MGEGHNSNRLSIPASVLISISANMGGGHVPQNEPLVPPSLRIESIEEPWKSRLPMFCKLLLATTYQASLKMMTDEIRHSI